MLVVILGVVSRCILKDSIDVAEIGAGMLAASFLYLPFTCLFIYATALVYKYRRMDGPGDAHKVRSHAFSILFLWLVFSLLYSLLSGGGF